jgi:2-desacetyl-2-hydroxyethyl bacteriochlorophyllide A dehydrogenase
MKAKRLVIRAIGVVEWETQELPDELKPKMILLESLTSLISAGTELAVYSGTHIGYTLPNALFPVLPHYPGYSTVGRVLAVGSQVETVRLGDRVMAEVPHADKFIIDEDDEAYAVLPDDISNHTGSFIRMAEIALTAVRLAPIQLGDTVAVMGLGLVGQFAAQLYRLHGSNPTIGIDLLPSRLAAAQTQGIKVFNPDEVDIFQELSNLLGDRSPDVVVEATGSANVLSLCLKLAKNGGRVIILGSTRAKVEIDVYSEIHRKGIQLIGAHEFANRFKNTPSHWTQKRNLQLLNNLFRYGRLVGEDLISHIIKSEELTTIYDHISNKPDEHLGVIIDWQK